MMVIQNRVNRTNCLKNQLDVKTMMFFRKGFENVITEFKGIKKVE